MEYYTSILQNMATSDREFNTNLSEDLSPKESEKGSVVCEENDVAIRNKNDPEACSGDSTVDRNKVGDLGTDGQEYFMNENRNEGSQNTAGNIDCESNNTACKSLVTEKQDCSRTKSEEGQKPDGFGESSLPLPRCGGRGVDEALLEEDEVGCSGDEEEHYESAEEEHYTPEEAEERMKEALELKKEGNDHFRNQEYAEGKDLYTKAIKRCPKEFTENKSIFYANRAACFQKLEDYENAISDCSKALELAPNYLKARLRRAQCYEKVEKLEEALEDYKIVFENDKSCQPAREAILRLPEEIKIKHEKLKEEMIGKLKDLGNMVLRPFGLSTDNFKLQQDPNSGGYSINFQK